MNDSPPTRPQPALPGPDPRSAAIPQIPDSQWQWHLLGPKRIERRKLPVVLPATGELLIRIDAALTCGTDLKVFLAGGHARMLEPPCPFGHEMAGTIVALGERKRSPLGESAPPGDPPGDVGSAAETSGLWQVGDRVVVANSASCGRCPPCLSGRENLCTDLHYLNGAFGEYLVLPERFVRRSLHRIPSALSTADAALAEPLACVLHMMELLQGDLQLWQPEGHSRPGLEAAVFGAGPLGLLITHQLTSAGLAVTTADPNPQRLAVAAQFGAHRTVALQRTPGHDPELSVPDRLLERRHHVAIDASGTLDGWLSALGAVRPGGTAVFFGGVSAGVLALRAHPIHYDEINLRGVYHHRPATFRRALSVLTSGSLPVDSLISDRLPLGQLEEALDSMMHRRALKVLLQP
jgi:L-iditol 2-dehydrogenase